MIVVLILAVSILLVDKYTKDITNTTSSSGNNKKDID